jgi:lysyl endopeptidase
VRKIVYASLVLALAWGNAGAAGFSADKSKITFDALDMDRVALEDAAGDVKGVGKYRFAIPHDVQINTAGHGTWETKADGSMVWRFEVETPDAAHLNFGFSPFHLPDGARLLILSSPAGEKLGPFTAADNNASGQFWTSVLKADSAVIELSLPANALPALQFGIVRIGHGYRGFGATAKHCKSGACETDVACLSVGDPWNNPRRSVAAYTVGGTDTCTGSLVNNTANDKRMLFATATHCGVASDATGASLVAYFNYESPTCRRPGSSASGQIVPRPNTTMSGVRFLAQTANPFAGSAPAGNRSDFTLLEFLQPANPAYNLYWAGWDRRNIDPVCAAPPNIASTDGLCASIHHPNVDEKRITFVEATMQTGNISGATGVHWHPFWDPTPPQLPAFPPGAAVPPSVTEPGSSGSPLYNASQRLIGVLSGGPSQCGSTGANLSDFYGKLAHAWDGLGTPTTAMKSYLDPGGTNPDFINGRAECTAPSQPTGVTATASAPNAITVNWTAVSGITTYRVFRSTGACPGSNFVQIAEVTSGTSYVDTTVSGGSTYSYKVSSRDTVQPCDSTQSDCSSATATGVCNLSPTFAGATSAASGGTTSCSVNVNWAAAAQNCGASGQVRYNVYRSLTAGFTPNASTLYQACVTGTSFNDTAVSSTNTYHYVVRAEDSNGAGSGLCAAGLEDTNTVQKSAQPAGPDTNAFTDNAESGLAQWTVAGTGGGANFAVVNTQSNSPSNSFFAPDPDVTSDRTMTMTNAVTVPNAAGTTLEFYIRYFTEANYDGTRLEYSLDNGTTWTDILAAQGAVPANASRFLSGGYNGTMNANGAWGAGIAWHGDFSTNWIRSSVNLTAFAGQNVKFRFHFKSDGSVDELGFWVDDIRLFYGSACTANLPDAIFDDNFDPPAGH